MNPTFNKLSQLLESAKKGELASMKPLFTEGGCHAFAFAAALRKNGAAVLMTKIRIPYDTHFAIEGRFHAWATYGAVARDYYGEIQNVDGLLHRYSQIHGWFPQVEQHRNNGVTVAAFRSMLRQQLGL